MACFSLCDPEWVPNMLHLTSCVILYMQETHLVSLLAGYVILELCVTAALQCIQVAVIRLIHVLFCV